ncbi:Dicarboxylate/amino acid:cation symporter, partial [Globisporangium splendens]
MVPSSPPPRFTQPLSSHGMASSNGLSSFGDLHDHGSDFSLQHSSQQLHPQFAYDHEDGVEHDEGPLEVRGEVPSSDLSNVNTLHVLISAIVGMVAAIVISQTSSDENVGDSAVMRWLLLPGELYVNAMLCVVLPSIFLHSALGSMHFSTLNKTKALGSKMLVLFAVTTLWASVLGVLVALCFTPMFYENQTLRSVATEASVLPRDTALIKLTCPQLSTSNHSSSLLVQQDGSMRCTQPLEDVNGTRFLLDDIAHSFHINATTQRIPSLGEQVVKVLETVFPANLLQSFLDGDVLSVILAGMALGVALLHFSSISSVAGTSDSSLLFLLMMQAEVILSVLLGFLLRILPGAIGFIVCDLLLRSSPPESTSEAMTVSMQDLASLFGVLLFALVLHFGSMLSIAYLVVRSNPLPFLKYLLPAQLVALATSSSLIALPTTARSIAATKQVSMPLAHFVCSTGTVLNNNGSAIYVSVASVYLISTAALPGHEITGGNVVLVMLASFLCSFVIAPLESHGGSTGVVVGTILVSIFDVDPRSAAVLISFLAGMDWLCDPFMSALNVTNDALVAWILAHQMDERFIDQSFDTQEDLTTDDGLDESGQERRTRALNNVIIRQQQHSIRESEVFI